MDKRLISFSGIQPSGIPTIGNYLGAIRRWAADSETEGIYCVVDLHALTVRPDPQELKKRVRLLYALLLAAGIDTAKNLLFVQSHVAAHTELSWILDSYTMFGELSRMTQFKDKKGKKEENNNAGLFTYPVLMAADILLYDTDRVPIGEDQKQHVELCRNIALRFNGIHGDVFKIPEAVLGKVGARIMSLQDPARKMDKSDPNPAAFLSLTDDRDTLIKKCRRAVTDSESEVRYDPQNKPGVSNLLTLYALCTDKSLEEAEKDFAGQGYGALKSAVGEAADSVISPLRRRIDDMLAVPAHLDKLMREQAEKAAAKASRTLRRVKETVGI